METNSNFSSRDNKYYSNVRSSKNSSVRQGVVFGLLLILAGFLFLSFNFGWIDPSLRGVIFSWPIVFIVLSILSFSKRDYLVGVIFLILGFFFFLPRLAMIYPETFSGIDTSFTRTYWPVLLILVGIVMVVRIGSGKRGTGYRNRQNVADNHLGESGSVNKNVIFGGSESIFLDPVFNGGNISATFGGVVIDLRKTTLPEGDTYLDISTLFGGVQLYIPYEWVIDNRLQSIMGGVEDKRRVMDTDYSR